MELKEGQKLRVKEFDEMPNHWIVKMKEFENKIVTFKDKERTNYIKIFEDNNYYGGFDWEESDFQIVFDKWEDVKNAMKEECNKHELCDGCKLNDKERRYCYSLYFKTQNYKKLFENFQKMFEMECYVLEDENMNFKLEDIKDEMIVKLRNGIVYFALGENFIGRDGFMPKYKYSQNFKCLNSSDYDIVEVYPKNKYYTNGFKGMLIIDKNKNPLWKEEKESVTKDVSLEEINILLKEKYPDVEKFNLPIDK